MIFGIWEEAELFKGFGEQWQNTFREPRKLFSWNREDQCIIYRDQGSTAPTPWGRAQLWN